MQPSASQLQTKSRWVWAGWWCHLWGCSIWWRSLQRMSLYTGQSWKVKSPAFARRLLEINKIFWKGEPISWIFSETKANFFLCYFPNSAWPNWVLFPADSSMFFWVNTDSRSQLGNDTLRETILAIPLCQRRIFWSRPRWRHGIMWRFTSKCVGLCLLCMLCEIDMDVILYW